MTIDRPLENEDKDLFVDGLGPALTDLVPAKVVGRRLVRRQPVGIFSGAHVSPQTGRSKEKPKIRKSFCNLW
jgi:hypothetical protein